MNNTERHLPGFMDQFASHTVPPVRDLHVPAGMMTRNMQLALDAGFGRALAARPAGPQGLGAEYGSMSDRWNH